MKRFLIPFSAVLLAGFILTAFRADDDLFELRKNFEIFGSIYEEIAVGYVDDVRPAPFMRAGIEAMLGQLDPYTSYYDEADMVDMRLIRERKIGVVGVSLGLRGGRVTVLSPEDDAGAYRQGLRRGDVLLQIGEADTDGMVVAEAVEALSGDPGTTIDVLVQRSGENRSRSFKLLRERPRFTNVSFSGYLGADSTDGIAVVTLDRFGNRSGREVKRALRNMHRDVELKGIVLDLRDNPGGILGEAIDIVELFVPKQTVVVSTRSRADDSVTRYRTEEDPLFPDTPLVILMNRFSASASEIVAGALQDHDRAVIIGETSFGKGLVQIVRSLPYNASLKLTISHYFLPSGRTIHSAELNTASATVATPTVLDHTTAAGRLVRGGLGVEPDVAVGGAVVTELETALLQESAFFLFANQWVSAHCIQQGSQQDDPPANCAGDDDALFEEFSLWLDQSGFSLVTQTDLLLSELEASGAEEGYATLAPHLQELRTALGEEKATRLHEIRGRVISRLRSEIRGRIMDEREQAIAEMLEDEWMNEAEQLVRRPRNWRQMLSAN